MDLFWQVRYLDTRDKQFKDRDLWLETDTLDDVTKAAVELAYELKDAGHQLDMLCYRHLFREENYTKDELKSLYQGNNVHSIYIPNYFEDETGKELSNNRMGAVLTGNPNVVMFPAKFKQHDIDYMLADKKPIPIDQISLSQEQLKILGYFARDLREMLTSAFYKDGPGNLTGSGENELILETAVTDEEIRSFVTIFRRLYMEKEPANFIKAVEVFEKSTREYPISKWVKGIADEYKIELTLKPNFVPFLKKDFPFNRKRLIDVFLYTQYAHQPDVNRSYQFQECLLAVDNKKPLLTWLFFTEIWACSLKIRNAGVIVADFYDRYCKYHKISSDVLTSIFNDNPGIGMLEKKEARKARLFQKKVEELSVKIWITNGRPIGGPMKYVNQARDQLKTAITENKNKI